MTVGPIGLGAGELHLSLQSLGDLPFPADFKLSLSSLPTGNSAYLAFKQRVLQAQISHARGKGRSFVPTLPDTQLEVVEHGQRMVKAAAAQCRELLTAARAEIDNPKSKHSSIRALSGYRPVEKERQLWDGYFERYYLVTEKSRLKLRGGPHSEAAVAYMAAYVSDRKAAPGYGNHSAGVAMDFSTTMGKTTYGASMAQKVGWKKTPFYLWLEANAKAFHFFPYAKEPWHWEFRP